MTDLHLVEQGSGEPVLFVHGAFGWGTDHFPDQLALADEFRVVLMDRRGFGDSPATDQPGFYVDAVDIPEVLGAGGHLVGLSNGAVSCLLAAARAPQVVWSLTVIEPGAFGLLRGDPVVESLIEQDEACYARKETMTPEEFYICLAQAGGGEVPLPLDPPLTDMDRAAIASSMLEPKPWEVDLPLELLREALFPKLVVSGGGRQGSTESVRAGRNVANRVCDLLADHIGGRRVVVPGVGHNSQLEDPKTFNQALREFLRFASALRS